ncbi:ankyrin repeat-containing protein At5g02620-like isoform X2 [Corylus avellana]|uniref:ankyrin repeat-containing protein At5g02620-like isoform X2 n=1 Tax=Corylus avellana TaxID=13451 RepID=UPI00286B4491|nr:ankyrin repeat-containing protein At5g02620-like isoform X2 [Corylus avellana]
MASNGINPSQPSLPLFEGAGYDIWSIKMKTLFISQDLWDLVEKGYSEIGVSADTLKELRKKDAKALFFIQQAVAESIFLRIAAATKSKDAWDALQNGYQANAKKQEKTMEEGKPLEELEQIVLEEPRTKNEREIRYDEYQYPRHDTVLQDVLRGDWQAVQDFLKEDPHYVRAPISKDQGTALHNAVVAENTTLIKELLKLMTPEDLKLTTTKGATALHIAAQSKKVIIAEQLVKINNEQLLIRDSDGNIPLHIAAYHGHRNMIWYLISETPFDKLTANDRTKLLLDSICNDIYDIALQILQMDPSIATVDTSDGPCGWRALEMLAKKPSAIGSESRLSFWKRFLNTWFKGIYNKVLMKTLAHQLVEDLWEKVRTQDKQFSSNLFQYRETLIFKAAKVGNVEFLIILIQSYPDLIWQLDGDNMSLFHIAILYRKESVFNLIHEIGTNKYCLASIITSEKKENMLHLASRFSDHEDEKNIVLGAFRMLWELWWFKIKEIVPPSYSSLKNKEGRTPQELFKMTHRTCKKDSEKWIKETTQNCMVVATLIAAVAFAAAFTIPGGNNQETGTPIFLRSNLFTLFLLSDAMAMVTSSTSILAFMSMFMSRYTEEDFSESIPSTFLIGLSALFMSILSMLVAFCTAFFLMDNSVRAPRVPIVVLGLVSISITSLVLLQFDLLVDGFLHLYKYIFRSPLIERRLFKRKMPTRNEKE